MALYSLNTTLDQEALLTWVVGQYNAEHDTTFTNAQYVARRMPELLAPFAPRFRQATLDAVEQKFSDADAATQQQVKDILRVTV